MRSFKTSTFLAAVLAVVVSSLATADNAIVNVKTETVNYSDLRLTSKVGVAVLYGRLRGAAERACAPLAGEQLSAKSKYRSCYDDALAKAVVAVNHPGLSEYYEEKRGVAGTIVTVPSVTVVAKAR